jgi:hypothetical protein
MALPPWYVNTKDILADIWTNAGTRIIGWVSIVIGVLGTLDAATVGYVEQFLGPKWGKAFGPVCLICAGLMTRQRGARNTADIADHIINRANIGDPAATTAVSAATSNAVAASDKVLLVNKPSGDPKP